MKHRSVRLLMPLLIALCLALPARAEMLVGGVAHADFLPAVTPAFAQQINAQAAAPALDWFPIPGFMAGSWSKRGDVTVSETDASGYTRPMNEWTENAMTVTWGTQTDKLGDIWHLNTLPCLRLGHSGENEVRFVTVAMKCERTDKDQMVTRTRYVVTETDARTNQVASEFQQESLNLYTLLRDGQLQNESSNRVYDLSGRPMRSGTLLSRFVRSAPFNAVASANGIDYAQSLNEYLREHKLEQLVKQ